jgi:phosphonopyruvate decarboxylase
VRVEILLDAIGAEFFTGVPDSLLRPLCDCLYDRYGISDRHIVAANEGNAAALAAGWHLASGKTALVYLQNSGLGNLLNPAVSLLHEKVYGIPCLFIVGWRGEPGVHDEPQHSFQGEITLSLLEQMGIVASVIDQNTTEAEILEKCTEYRSLFQKGRQAAFVVRKGALSYDGSISYQNGYAMTREEAIRQVLSVSKGDVMVATTGKASRELYELRAIQGSGHGHDFLTVGSMGHSSSIALGIALQRKNRQVWCIDGDGAALMHLGAMALIGARRPANLLHVVLNNAAHESVGGMPTAASELDLAAIARACGYPSAVSVDTPEKLGPALREARAGGRLALIEIKCAMGARADLGRPKTSPLENKIAFMADLEGRL